MTAQELVFPIKSPLSQELVIGKSRRIMKNIEVCSIIQSKLNLSKITLSIRKKLPSLMTKSSQKKKIIITATPPTTPLLNLCRGAKIDNVVISVLSPLNKPFL